MRMRDGPRAPGQLPRGLGSGDVKRKRLSQLASHGVGDGLQRRNRASMLADGGNGGVETTRSKQNEFRQV
jgi:hypothetical protein